MLYDTPKRRRLLMPLVILLVGGAIALWGTQRETKHSEDVRQAVLSLCRDLKMGQDVSTRLKAMTSGENPLLLKALENTCLAAQDVSDIQVKVTPGDIELGGIFSGDATHTAIIHVDGAGMLGLRVRHSDGTPLQIVGHFTPASN